MYWDFSEVRKAEIEVQSPKKLVFLGRRDSGTLSIEHITFWVKAAFWDIHEAGRTSYWHGLEAWCRVKPAQ